MGRFAKSGYGHLCSSSLEQNYCEVQSHSLNSNAQLIGRAIRKHWALKNEAHWTLDTFAEDACRIVFHSPENFALLRRIALNALNREQTTDVVPPKMKRTAMEI